jgi:hypothetical protein
LSQCRSAAAAAILQFMSTLETPLAGPGQSAAEPRDPSAELFERACDLLAAAEAMRPAAGQPGSAPAIAATLGCVETALEALVDAAAAMRAEMARQLARDDAGASEHASGVSRRTAQREFSELVGALRGAHRATDHMRARVGPLLTQLTLPGAGAIRR